MFLFFCSFAQKKLTPMKFNYAQSSENCCECFCTLQWKNFFSLDDGLKVSYSLSPKKTLSKFRMRVTKVKLITYYKFFISSKKLIKNRTSQKRIYKFRNFLLNTWGGAENLCKRNQSIMFFWGTSNIRDIFWLTISLPTSVAIWFIIFIFFSFFVCNYYPMNFQ